MTTPTEFLPRSDGWAVDMWLVKDGDGRTVGTVYRDDRGEYIAEVNDPDGKYDLPDRFGTVDEAAAAIDEVMAG